MRTVKIKARAMAIDHAVKEASKAGHKFAHVSVEPTKGGRLKYEHVHFNFYTNNVGKIASDKFTTHKAKPSP